MSLSTGAGPPSAGPVNGPATATSQPPTLYYPHQQPHHHAGPALAHDADTLVTSTQPSAHQPLGKRQRSTPSADDLHTSSQQQQQHQQLSNGYTNSHSPNKASATQPHSKKPSRRTTNKQRLQELLSEIDWTKFNEILELMRLDPTAVTSLVADHAAVTARGNSSLYLQLMLTSLVIPFASVFGVTNPQSGQRERLDFNPPTTAALLKTENRSYVWTPEDDEQLIQLREKQLPFPDIARLMDRTLGSVKKHYYTLTNTKPEGNDSDHDNEDRHGNAAHADSEPGLPPQPLASPPDLPSPASDNPASSVPSTAELTDYAVRAAAEQVNNMIAASNDDLHSSSAVATHMQHSGTPLDHDNSSQSPRTTTTTTTGSGKVMQPWRQSEKRKADAMKLEGCSLAEIARALDRTVKSVDGHFKRQRARLKREAALEMKHREEGTVVESLVPQQHHASKSQRDDDEQSHSGSSVSQQQLISTAVARATQHHPPAVQLIDPVHSHHHHQHQHHVHDTHHTDAHTVQLPSLVGTDFAAHFSASDSMDESHFHHHTSMPSLPIMPSNSNSLQSLNDPMYHSVHTPPAYNLQPPTTQPQQLSHNLNHYR